jgi:hypothetical protein
MLLITLKKSAILDQGGFPFEARAVYGEPVEKFPPPNLERQPILRVWVSHYVPSVHAPGEVPRLELPTELHVEIETKNIAVCQSIDDEKEPADETE